MSKTRTLLMILAFVAFVVISFIAYVVSWQKTSDPYAREPLPARATVMVSA